MIRVFVFLLLGVTFSIALMYLAPWWSGEQASQGLGHLNSNWVYGPLAGRIWVCMAIGFVLFVLWVATKRTLIDAVILLAPAAFWVLIYNALNNVPATTNIDYLSVFSSHAPGNDVAAMRVIGIFLLLCCTIGFTLAALCDWLWQYAINRPTQAKSISGKDARRSVE